MSPRLYSMIYSNEFTNCFKLIFIHINANIRRAWANTRASLAIIEASDAASFNLIILDSRPHLVTAVNSNRDSNSGLGCPIYRIACTLVDMDTEFAKLELITSQNVDFLSLW
jgi:hypothetical protein